MSMFSIDNEFVSWNDSNHWIDHFVSKFYFVKISTASCIKYIQECITHVANNNNYHQVNIYIFPCTVGY